MYKTKWQVKSELGYITNVICYHFGKHPHFPTYLLEENETYEITMIWNCKLINTFEIFLKCLFYKNSIIFEEK